MVIEQRNILTIATGKNLFFNMAVNLASSFVWWHPVTDIKFYLVTDLDLVIPHYLKNRIILQKIKSAEIGSGFSSKLYLDRFAPDGKTLFIDSDCLIFGNLDFLFESFRNHVVSVIGNYINEGEWFGNIRQVCLQFNILQLPKFNGGIYYLEKGITATKVYQTARELEKRYDEIGFVRLRNQPNDEVLMALAMQLHHQTPLIDDGTIMSDPQACQGKYKIDIIKGYRQLINPKLPSPLHQTWYPFDEVSPVIVHFLGYYTQHYPYKREIYRLKKALNNQSGILSEVIARLTIQYPEQSKNWFKKTFRPIYHAVFRIRSIKQSERML